ncbi:tryptophan 2,3-dioxygenase family protein [Micromonospora sp. WMMA1923]|uniref:tryptophan 2,3-dioxygenase family protein n=1 Tax=Micromonospora sp. WMMA1923 TaxID=3404125 RepID=UPI003B937DAF
MTDTEPLRRWLTRRPLTARHFPYTAVIAAYHHHGKHHVPDRWTRLLRTARDQYPNVPGTQGRHLRAFLANTLDKTDGRYAYPTYLALNLLPMPDPDDPPAPAARLLARRDRLHAHLLADLIAFELAATHDPSTPLPDLRPDRTLTTKRLRHATRAALPALHRLRLIDPRTADDPHTVATQIAAAVTIDRTPEEHLLLGASMLPVSTVHDEWMFIRILQTFETTFALLAVDLRDIITATRTGRTRTAALRLTTAANLLRESTPLWSVMATLQPQAFHQFRPHTDGASAIQSHHYKLVESLCRRPHPDRRDSAAYRSVPHVRTRILDGQPGLDDILDHLTHTTTADDARTLAPAMATFATALRQWRHTHYRLAVRMLGTDQPGTGHTHGTPYLADTRHHPVFRRCPDAGPPNGPES